MNQQPFLCWLPMTYYVSSYEESLQRRRYIREAAVFPLFAPGIEVKSRNTVHTALCSPALWFQTPISKKETPTTYESSFKKKQYIAINTLAYSSKRLGECQTELTLSLKSERQDRTPWLPSIFTLIFHHSIFMLELPNSFGFHRILHGIYPVSCSSRAFP